MSDRTISALLPVHAGVQVDHLAEALESLLQQTRVPDEIVIVEDGPLGAIHEHFLGSVSRRHPRLVRVQSKTNRGAGIANQLGLEAATGEWIAKADADDVNLAHRLETQLNTVLATGVEVCGSAMLEFVDRIENVVSLRRMPASHGAIGSRLRWNNPINHPTAFYRRDAALAVGGYPPWRNMQDYGLFARMYAAGAHMMNLEEPLVRYRSGELVTGRRRSALTRRLEWDLQRELCSLGIVSRPLMIANVCWRQAFRLLPARAVQLTSRRVLASHPGAAKPI
jgi:glycosyltransferase involved in cell wall biosynthesis